MTDADALASFETLLATQEPAKQAWTPVTDYSYCARLQAEGPTPHLLLSVFQTKDILDAGCGFGHLVRMLRECGAHAEGFDATERIEWMHSPHLKVDNLLSSRPWDMKYHLVVCREVIEHLTVKQIRKAVVNLCALSSRFVYVTTRFNESPQHLLDVQTSDDLDPTHISLLPQELLRLFFTLEGFTRREDLEQQMDWRKLGRVLVYER